MKKLLTMLAISLLVACGSKEPVVTEEVVATDSVVVEEVVDSSVVAVDSVIVE
jgi:hypothetical protein